MAIAQSHADKEQDCQAGLYNRHTKGMSICVGDRVLVSNKRERGKRKTADRWESTMYTVVAMNPTTQTYWIQNPTTGQDRVVHHNLLMLVNFLPLDTSNQSDHSPALSTEQFDNVPDSHILDSVVEEDSRIRTREWVSCLSSASSDVAQMDDSVREPVNDYVADEESLVSLSEIDYDQISTQAPLADTQSVHSQVCHVTQSDMNSDTDTIHTVKTRVYKKIYKLFPP